jgi:hypothetical protein
MLQHPPCGLTPKNQQRVGVDSFGECDRYAAAAEVHFTRRLSNEIVTANKNSTCTTYQMLIWPVFAIDFVPRLLLPLARKKKLGCRNNVLRGLGCGC